MPLATADTLRVPVDGAELGCVRWRGRAGAPIVVAVHGITANAWSWEAVARHLDGEIGLVAVDLRGRGSSSTAPAPFGLRRHADDVATVIDRLNAGPAVVVGHSLGAHIALVCAELHPDAIGRLVLVDGGVPLAMPDGRDPQEALDELVGPAIVRLSKIWPDRVTYQEMWRLHPAFAGRLTPEIERYLLSDLAPVDGGFRSVVNEEAVRIDGTESLTDDMFRGAFERRARPVIFIRAEHGVMGGPPPLIDPAWVERCPHHEWRTVRGTNHYTVQLGETGAAAIAESLLKAANELSPP